jgi:3-(3-hydroxy-phenyl)propionate hydroxylase
VAKARYDIAIVGMGPTGGTLANLLGAAGLSVLVIEREATVYPLPRAIHFDGEVMRILQSLGLRDAALAISRPGTQGMHFVNADFRTLLIRGGSTELGLHGCANNYYFHQPELEALLRQGLERYPSVDVRLRHELERLEQEADGVTLQVRDRASDTVAQFSASYVVGCDGARSAVRSHMGSPMVDLDLSQPWLVFDVMLQEPVDLPDHTIQICDPARPMTYCNVVGNRRRWEIMVLPGDDRAALVEQDNLWRMVSPWVRPDQATLERAVIYTFQAVVAQGWRQGRLLLAGDACHQTPPFLGQGMCAGIRDASNLAWKLVDVVRGRADAALLDKYEHERAPHVRALIELAVELGHVIQTTDVAQAVQRDARFVADSPTVFELPRPALEVFPQPRLHDGQLLDNVLGRRHAIIGRAKTLDGLPAAIRLRLQKDDFAILDDAEPALAEWLEERAVDAVVLRPDRYIVCTARTTADLEHQLEQMVLQQAPRADAT